MFNGCCLKRKYFRPPPPHSSSAILRNLHRIHSGYNPNKQSLTLKPFLTNSLTESSDSPKSLNQKFLLQELVDSFNLLSDYFPQLPRDLRLDRNDAAFDLSNGPMMEKCGQELGMTLLNISWAWESADISTSKALVNDLPSLVNSLTSNNKSALSKRLTSAGRRFQSMGQYGQAELQRISKAMISTGKLLSSTPVSEETKDESKGETRMFKLGAAKWISIFSLILILGVKNLLWGKYCYVLNSIGVMSQLLETIRVVIVNGHLY
ncbi:hypothetical protein Hanom_Chr08g00692721 [Helianthus anomalus]